MWTLVSYTKFHYTAYSLIFSFNFKTHKKYLPKLNIKPRKYNNSSFIISQFRTFFKIDGEFYFIYFKNLIWSKSNKFNIYFAICSTQLCSPLPFFWRPLIFLGLIQIQNDFFFKAKGKLRVIMNHLYCIMYYVQ